MSKYETSQIFAGCHWFSPYLFLYTDADIQENIVFLVNQDDSVFDIYMYRMDPYAPSKACNY